MEKTTVFVHSDYTAGNVDMEYSVLKQIRNSIELVVLPMQQHKLAKVVDRLGIPFEEYPLPFVSYGVYFNSMMNMFMPKLFIVHVAYPSPQTLYISRYAKLRNVPVKYI